MTEISWLALLEFSSANCYMPPSSLLNDVNKVTSALNFHTGTFRRLVCSTVKSRHKGLATVMAAG